MRLLLSFVLTLCAMLCLAHDTPLTGLTTDTAVATHLPIAQTGLVPLETNPINGQKMPCFAADTSWPRIPSGFLIGQVSGVAVDPQGDIWVVNRPNSLHAMDLGAMQTPPISLCCRPLQEVIEFSPQGEIKRNWSGQASAPTIAGVKQYPANIHGIFVDDDESVWIAGNGPGDHLVARFTSEGQHLAQFGQKNKTQGNLDKQMLGNPADIHFDPATSQVLIADGYTNRRVIEFDYNSKRFQRYWGAFAGLPEDASRDKAFDFTQAMTTPQGGVDPAMRTFSDIVHCVVRGPDDLLYVCDRRNNRIQVFSQSTDGAVTFVETIEIAPVTGGTGSATDIAWSGDGTYMYVADMINGRIWVFDSQTREKLGSIGRPGRYAGQFHWLHSLDADAQGNLYATEVHTGQRVQKLVFLGVE